MYEPYWRGPILSPLHAEKIISKTTTGFFVVGGLMALLAITSRGSLLGALIFLGASYMLQRTKHRNWAYVLMFLPAMCVIFTPITAVVLFTQGDIGLAAAMIALTAIWLVPLQATRRAVQATNYIRRELAVLP